MERDLTRWLKDDLNLRHMSEADLNGLIYHPRHGSLCRRFVRFLAESALCNKKYPNVTAREECEMARAELREKRRELHDVMVKLNERLQLGANIEHELSSLKERCNYVKKIEDLLKTSNDALEQMADRSNFCFDQVRACLESQQRRLLANGLSGSAAAPSKSGAPDEFSKTSCQVNERQLKKLEERHDELLETSEFLDRAVGLLFLEAQQQVAESGGGALGEVKKAAVGELEALKLPEREELELPEVNREERELEREQGELLARFALERQQVTNLKQQHESERASLNQRGEAELKECMDFLAKLGEFKALLDEPEAAEQQQQQQQP